MGTDLSKNGRIKIYRQRIESFNAQLSAVKKKINQSSILRLISFAALIGLIVLVFPHFNLIIPIVLIWGVGFYYLVIQHRKFLLKRDRLSYLVTINELEISALNGNVSHFPNGNRFIDPLHPFCLDLDIFGEKSFFQTINRCSTPDGERTLAKQILSNDITDIQHKQELLQELSEKLDWRQDFAASAVRVDTPVHSSEILDWMQHRTSFTKKWHPWLFHGLTIGSLANIILIFSGVLPYWSLFINLALGGLILSPFRKKVEALYISIGRIKNTIDQYNDLINLVEQADFQSESAKQKQSSIHFTGTEKTRKASEIFGTFNQIVDAFDQRNNAFIALFGNTLALWDLRQSYRMEQWINQYKSLLAEWFKVISWFDACNSLANFTYNHPQYVVPEVLNSSDSSKRVMAKSLGHISIPKEKRIDNDFELDQNGFQIITGANMAGKSTFLRTVGLSFVMANCGLPVCAETFQYQPAKMISSMRTSDSLSDETSYFFAELKRLKFIMETIETGESWFILLDEILKGTNSKDKAEGSQRFMEKIIRTNSCGIIATHDLSICTIAEKYENVSNYYFDAEIINDELHFDYKLKNGVCKNMNASFLLRKMGIA